MLDLGLGLDGQFRPERAEEFDPVVAEGIMRRRDHGAGHEPLLGEVGHPGGRQDPDIEHVGPFGGQAGGERGLEERSRSAGVAPDDEGDRGQDACGGPTEGSASSAVSSSLATPLTPSVPNFAGATFALTAWSTAAPCGPSSGRTSWIPSRGRRG